jgi:beta-lactamase regulating signal transducer with metallopeptidase domain
MDAVLNWMWQGCVVVLALSAMLRLLEGARANIRYVVCWAALLLVVALPALPGLGSLELRHEALGLSPAGAILSVPDAWWTSGAVLVAAWSVWASVYTVRFVSAMVALRCARARSRSFPAQVESRLSHWRQVRGEGRRPSLVLSEAVTTAAVLGCGAPVIAVAPSMLTALDADELDHLLIHEWAHVQRRDDFVHLLQVFVRVVAGWHPAAWWIDRRLHVEREIACDEMTVEVTGTAKSYAACLVKLAGLNGLKRTALAAPAALTASGLRTRVTRIVARRSFISPLWSRGIATAIVSALCVVSAAVGGLKLVEATVLALPLDSLRAIGTGLDRVVSVATPTFASPVEPPPLPGRKVTSARPARRPIAEEPPPVTYGAAHPGPPPTVAPESAVTSTGLHATAEDGADAEAVPAETSADTEAAPEPSAVLEAAPTQLPHAVVENSRTLWSAAADGGTAIGRKSKEAGVATAGFFTRFARRVAGSF